MPCFTPAPRRQFLRRSASVLLASAVAPWLPPPNATAAPKPPEPEDARLLALDHTHTREQIALVYALGPECLPPALHSLNYFLRDHYSGEVGQIDPQLFHLLHHLRQTLGTEQPFEIISGYRSPLTNATLRQSRAGGVAKRSLHMEGKALDVRLPGVPLDDLRDAALGLRAGGVGFYPREQFVHLDTGAVRQWVG